jgi:capsular exopolysaccharide synthesis family protein
LAPSDIKSSSFKDDQIDVADIARTIGRRWRRIALITVLATLYALFLVLGSHPQFVVTGSLYLGDAQSSAASAAADASGLDFLSDFQSVSDVETQIRLLQAHALVEQAVLETGLNATITPKTGGTMPFWRWRFVYGESLDAFAPPPDGLQVLYATMTDRGARGAVFDLVFDDAGQFHLCAGSCAGGKSVLAGAVNQPVAGAGVAFLLKPNAQGYVPAAGSDYTLTIEPVRAVAAKLLLGPLSISASGTGDSTPTKLADVSFQCGNPYQGQAFVDQLMEDFIATQLAWKTQSASATEDFVAGQLQKITTSLQVADEKLAAYQSKTGIVDVPANAQALIQQLAQYEVQRTTVLLQQEDLQQLGQSIAHPAGGLNPYLVSQSNDPQLAALSTQLASAEVQLAGAETQLTGNTDEVQTQQATIAKIEDAIRTLVQNDAAVAVRSLSNIDQLIQNFEAQLRTMPSEALKVVTLTRSSDVFGQLYVLLMQKEEEAEVSKAATIVDTRVVTPAEFPLNSISPKAALTVLTGLFLGLSAGIGLVLAQRALSSRFQSEDEVRRSYALPVYALIPLRSATENTAGIFSSRPQGPFAEAFRLLRGNLYQSTTDMKARVIMITSATSADGKTTVAANVSKILADDGKRVLLMDADLHRGRVHEPMKLRQVPGLAEWLVTGVRPNFQAPESQQFLVLTTGTLPPNPSELINEPVLAQIFASLREQFDYIIVDCPPLPTVVDTMSLSPYADLLLSVVNIAHTPRRAFAAHMETISTLERRSGMIINGVQTRASGYGYSAGYGYSYGYGAGDREQGWFVKMLDWLRRLWEG